MVEARVSTVKIWIMDMDAFLVFFMPSLCLPVTAPTHNAAGFNLLKAKNTTSRVRRAIIEYFERVKRKDQPNHNEIGDRNYAFGSVTFAGRYIELATVAANGARD